MVESKKYLVGGNWKSNGTLASVKDLVEGVLNKLEYNRDKVGKYKFLNFLTLHIDVVVAPVNIHLALVKTLIREDIHVAAQNSSATGQGAFTGEVTADQLVDFGLKWVILGHSERRSIYHESSEEVAKKTKVALEKGLNVILCIGEKLEQRENGTTNDVLKSQLDAVKGSISDWSKVVVAYEPVWAIGTGKVASPDQA
jgi:triosephosphate isomerase